MERWGSANHWKKWIFRGKITYFISVFKRGCNYILSISKYIELEPWGWSQMKKYNHIFQFLQNFWPFFISMKILINFLEFEVCMTAEFFLKSMATSWNIQIFSNFLTKLKSMIYFLPFQTFPGATAFFFRNGMQTKKASLWKKFGRIVPASKMNFIWCFANPQLSNTPILGFV